MTLSWGRFPRTAQRSRDLAWLTDVQPAIDAESLFLPLGNGRSYGDVCLNDAGTLLRTTHLDRFLAFDRDAGVLRAEAGVTLREINRLTIPAGWFVHVTPGTQDVTLGGAIANDVHGKNHHRHGSFGRHVVSFELARSDGPVQVCSADVQAGLFTATIGGLGLTGLIRWAEIRLRRIPGPFLEISTTAFHSFAEFLRLSQNAEHIQEYTVAWFQCVAAGKRPVAIRGLFSAGDHREAQRVSRVSDYVRDPIATVPVELPGWAMNRHLGRAFNFTYFHSGRRNKAPVLLPCSEFFYPLDAVASWNRLYGRCGFLQHQCVLPMAGVEDAFGALMAGVGDTPFFLGVLKVFGEAAPAGMLSFARRGVTVAMDFRNEGEATLALFGRLNAVAAECGGAVYPAKDATMSSEVFERGYPHWREFGRFRDPRISSNFWRRVTEGSMQ